MNSLEEGDFLKSHHFHVSIQLIAHSRTTKIRLLCQLAAIFTRILSKIHNNYKLPIEKVNLVTRDVYRYPKLSGHRAEQLKIRGNNKNIDLPFFIVCTTCAFMAFGGVLDRIYGEEYREAYI